MEGCGSCVSPQQWDVALGSPLEVVIQGLEDLSTARYKAGDRSSPNLKIAAFCTV